MPFHNQYSFQRTSKLSARHIRPFWVVEQIGVVAYNLALQDTMCSMHLVFGSCDTFSPSCCLSTSIYRPPTLSPFFRLIEDTREYEGVRILQKHTFYLGCKIIIEYLILWKGYPLHQDTWGEPIDNPTHYVIALCHFEQSCNEDLAS